MHNEYNELIVNSIDDGLSLSNIINSETIAMDDRYICDMCGQIFPDENALMVHERLHQQSSEESHNNNYDVDNNEDGEVEEEYLLNEDDVVIDTEKNNYNSIASDSSTKKSIPYLRKCLNGQFECTICHKSFQMKSNVREHYFRLHCGSKLLQCSQCKFTCYSKSALDVHLVKSHTKRYTCEKCGKMFPYKYQLTTHINGVHLNIRNHTCDLCGKSFKTRANFDTHMSRHKDIRNFPCPHCDHRSRTSHDLNVHLRKHTGEKPYSCDVCGKSFAHSINRIKHQKSIHGPSLIEQLSRLQSSKQIVDGNREWKVERRRILPRPRLSQTAELDTLQFPDNELASD